MPHLFSLLFTSYFFLSPFLLYLLFFSYLPIPSLLSSFLPSPPLYISSTPCPLTRLPPRGPRQKRLQLSLFRHPLSMCSVPLPSSFPPIFMHFLDPLYSPALSVYSTGSKTLGGSYLPRKREWSLERRTDLYSGAPLSLRVVRIAVAACHRQRRLR